MKDEREVGREREREKVELVGSSDMVRGEEKNEKEREMRA
jgi:hypothetical protein